MSRSIDLCCPRLAHPPQVRNPCQRSGIKQNASAPNQLGLAGRSLRAATIVSRPKSSIRSSRFLAWAEPW